MQGFALVSGRAFARICEIFGRGFYKDLRDFRERICKALGEDLQGFAEYFGRGFARICETLREDLQDFVRPGERIHKDLQDFGGGYARICKDSLVSERGFTRICEIFGRGFCKDLHETLGEDSQVFT